MCVKYTETPLSVRALSRTLQPLAHNIISLNNYSLKNNSSLVDLHCATVPSSFVTLGTHFLLAFGL